MEYSYRNTLIMKGFILITVLIFLFIFSLLALTSMQTSIVQLKLSSDELVTMSSLRGAERRSNPSTSLREAQRRSNPENYFKELTMCENKPAIYIMANKHNGTLYTGVTKNLIRRVHQHKENHIEGFTERYDCKKLVYYEVYEDMLTAIEREKQIKGGSRRKKLQLIENVNPEWKDLYNDLL